ncbi:MAG TPA: MFS transporter [Gammaproteobacteria bacterium]|nr:MFS transporter [Gammaproteobacteria bacterium]
MEVANKINITELIDRTKVGRFQMMLFALCAMSLIMDGFDVQAMGYVAPDVTRDFGMSGAQLGNLLASANFGVLIGSLLFTILADKIGRRPVLIFGTFYYAVITVLTGRAGSPDELLLLRFIGGIGMGSIIPNASALIGEYSPNTKRITLIMTITVGFTAGAALGGFVAAALLPVFGWRSVFYFGGIIPLAAGILMIFWLPESLQFLAVHRKFEKVGEWLKRINPAARIEAGTQYVVAEQHQRGVPVLHLLTGGRAPVTLLYWLVNFTNLLNLYFLAGLLPKILSQHDYSSSMSALIGGLLQAGGTVGTFGLAWFIHKKGFTPMLTVTFAVAAVSIAFIGSQPVLAAPALLMGVVALAGWCVIGGQPGLNALGATYYPTFMRSTGIGWGLGIGRVGAIVGPLIGGRLLDLHWSTQQLFIVFAVPAVVSTLVMLSLHVIFRSGGEPALPLKEEAA